MRVNIGASRGACLACEAVVSKGSRDAETPFRQGSVAEVCLFTHPRAQLNAAHLRPSALLTTASQARHAPRAVSLMNRSGGRGWISPLGLPVLLVNSLLVW
jgi:hypothetical protein